MKVCSNCNETKCPSLFYTRSESGKLRSECKDCLADKQRSYLSSWAISKRHQRKKDMVQSLGIKCSMCCGIFPVSVYDFHHTDPSTKEHSPTRYLLGSEEQRNKILNDCILLCANCHRIEHASNKSIPNEWLAE